MYSYQENVRASPKDSLNLQSQDSVFHTRSAPPPERPRDVHNQSSGDLANQSSDLPTDLSSASDSAFETGNGSSLSESDFFFGPSAGNEGASSQVHDVPHTATCAALMFDEEDDDEQIDVD